MQTFSFNVSFDALTKTVTTAGIGSSFPVPAPQGISLITFALDANAIAAGVVFSSTPIQWMQGGQPTALPPWFLMHRHDDHHFALWDFNSAPTQTQHDFVLSVFYEGQFYSNPDPTIINDPPTT